MFNEIRLLMGVGLMADTVATDLNGARVWLKEVFLNGKRIGVDVCCPESVPCEWHAALSQARRMGAGAAGRGTAK